MLTICKQIYIIFEYFQSELTTTLVVENMRMEADYTVTFPGSGEAPSETRSGTVTEKVSYYRVIQGPNNDDAIIVVNTCGIYFCEIL